MLEKSLEYQRRAEEVLAFLQSETDPAVRQAYAKIVESWLTLAEHALAADRGATAPPMDPEDGP